MQSKLITTLTLAAALALPQITLAAAQGETAVTVNGVAVPSAQAEVLRQDRLSRGQAAETLNDNAIREMLVTMEILAQEAVRQGIDKRPQVAATIELNRKDILGRLLLEDYLKNHPIKEEDMKAEYDRVKAASGNMEYRPRHILVQTEEEAKAILAKLAKKAKFEDLAKQQSKDQGSAKNGGELGWLLPSNLVPEFSEAMVKLKKGETAKTPVRTQYGWHVIRLDDVRELKFPDYEQLKPRISAQLQQLQVRKYLSELRAAAKVE